ncbi:ribonuclease HII [Bacillus sp. Bva_UNVM-123]|uniref:ribonuclease HII n=1 Tax=Bacillus sp. Bva_UNVM-123 TaxID=2829798 RepID=UPI00391F8983
MVQLKIQEIKAQLANEFDRDSHFIHSLKKDNRKGVIQLLEKWYRQRDQEKQLYEKHVRMTEFEMKLRKQGFHHIAGIDEVGRGPLAGPVVAAAVILPDDFYLPGLDDSKKLSEQRRNEFYDIIRSNALAVSSSIISVEELDKINIFEATKKAMLSSIVGLKVEPDFLLIDAVKLKTPYPQEAITKGDAKSVSIAAASIIAKVTRDRIMVELSKEYPEYGFSQNMGYGTKAHLSAIEKYGITPHHRKSFAPIKDYVII